MLRPRPWTRHGNRWRRAMPREESARPPLPARLDPRAGRPGPGTAHVDRPRRAAPRGLTLSVRALAGVLAVLVLGGSGWGWYLARVAEAGVSRTDAIPTEGNTDAQGGDHAGQAMNLLLV